MMFKFISASLWGCLGYVYVSIIPVTSITLTLLPTCLLNSVSATRWGSFI